MSSPASHKPSKEATHPTHAKANRKPLNLHQKELAPCANPTAAKTIVQARFIWTVARKVSKVMIRYLRPLRVIILLSAKENALDLQQIKG